MFSAHIKIKSVFKLNFTLIYSSTIFKEFTFLTGLYFNNSEIIYKNTKITKKTCISPVYKISTCISLSKNRNVFRKIFITHTQCSKKYSVYNSQDYLAPNIGLKKLTETIF